MEVFARKSGSFLSSVAFAACLSPMAVWRCSRARPNRGGGGGCARALTVYEPPPPKKEKMYNEGDSDGLDYY
jgi:hypothetical protein